MSLIKSALVARGTFVLCEYDASEEGDDLTEISRKVLGKIPRTGVIRSYVFGGHTFNYLLEKDLIFLCVAAMNAGSELVFQFLGDFRSRFATELARNTKAVDLTRILKGIMDEYNNNTSTTKVRQMERELEDVTDMMRDNLGKVMERGEGLDSLMAKTNILSSESISFRTSAKQFHDTLWWQDQRGRMMLGLVAACVLCMFSWYVWSSWHRTSVALEDE